MSCGEREGGGVQIEEDPRWTRGRPSGLSTGAKGAGEAED